MKKVVLRSLCLAWLIFISPSYAAALTPPTGNETLCYVEGEVLSHQSEEATDSLMNPVEVETMTLAIRSVKPLDESYKGSFCEQMTGLAQSPEQKSTFRLCDETDAPDGASINGIVGLSIGGGRYCIEKIQTIPAG